MSLSHTQGSVSLLTIHTVLRNTHQEHLGSPCGHFCSTISLAYLAFLGDPDRSWYTHGLHGSHSLVLWYFLHLSSPNIDSWTCFQSISMLLREFSTFQGSLFLLCASAFHQSEKPSLRLSSEYFLYIWCPSSPKSLILNFSYAVSVIGCLWCVIQCVTLRGSEDTTKINKS